MFLFSRYNRITGVGLLAFLGLVLCTAAADGQDKETIELKLHAKSVPESVTSVRLLPAENELRKGNAAVVYLRMPWEQSHFMNSYPAKISDWMELEYNAPEVMEEEHRFEHFVKMMRRAAYMEDANWEYPLGEVPAVSILLPDVQGMRMFMGRLTALWVGIQIEKGDLESAREGILIQFAGARHLCRTPFAVTGLVGIAISEFGFDRFQILIQQEKADNFYYALGMLPETLGDTAALFEFEGGLLEDSLPSLTNPYPGIGDPVWEKIAQEFSEMMPLFGGGQKVTPAGVVAFELRIFLHAKTELLEWEQFDEEELEKMGRNELIGRWILAQAKQFTSKRLAATLLPLPQGIQELIEIEKQVKALQDKLKAPANPFTAIGGGTFVALHRFTRNAKLFQVIEAIRDYASRHDNQLPNSLDDIELFVPLDPLTGKQFEYELKEGIATLSVPDIANVDKAINDRFPVYRIELVTEE